MSIKFFNCFLSHKDANFIKSLYCNFAGEDVLNIVKNYNEEPSGEEAKFRYVFAVVDGNKWDLKPKCIVDKDGFKYVRYGIGDGCSVENFNTNRYNAAKW